jgi:hypothetical protein
MSMKSSYRKVKPVHVIISMANGQSLRGILNIGFESRVSDFLSASEPAFVALFDVGEDRQVYILNKAQIASVQPLGAEAGELPAPGA